ncbi:MAG: hypothetical protein NTW69_00875 [Chloroflexi bacterium]|nr:hypothetical protein [Chloroflexota bacterium]
MDSTSGTFQFQLTLAELSWLAGSFGMTRLPLPEKSLSMTTPQSVQAELDKGSTSRITRGLIQRSASFGWQVDRLPSAIIRWFSTAESLLRVERIPKNGTAHHMHIFTMDQQGMSVEMDGDSVTFIFHEARSTMIDSLWKWLNLPTFAKKTEAVYQLPQPPIFIPAVWEDSKFVEEILKTAGIKVKVKETIAWVNSLETIAVLSKVHLDGKEDSLINQFVICANKKFTWAGNGGDNNENVSFVPMTMKKITTTMDDLL